MNADLEKSRKIPFSVIPAEAGIQSLHSLTEKPDPVFQRDGDFLQSYHGWRASAFKQGRWKCLKS
jgi:hypothetical protein